MGGIGENRPEEGARTPYPRAPQEKEGTKGRRACLWKRGGVVTKGGAPGAAWGGLGGRSELDWLQKWEGRGVWGRQGLDPVVVTMGFAAIDLIGGVAWGGLRGGTESSERPGWPEARTAPPGGGSLGWQSVSQNTCVSGVCGSEVAMLGVPGAGGVSARKQWVRHPDCMPAELTTLGRFVLQRVLGEVALPAELPRGSSGGLLQPASAPAVCRLLPDSLPSPPPNSRFPA